MPRPAKNPPIKLNNVNDKIVVRIFREAIRVVRNGGGPFTFTLRPPPKPRKRKP